MTIKKVWQPGVKNAAEVVTSVLSIQDLLQSEGVGDVELMKVDIDGPEILVLRGMAEIMAGGGAVNANGGRVKNIIIELSVNSWNDFGVSDKAVLDIFIRFFEVGYKMYLVYEREFGLYPQTTLAKLTERRDVGFVTKCYEVRKERVEEALNMVNRKTKNFWLTLEDRW